MHQKLDIKHQNWRGCAKFSIEVVLKKGQEHMKFLYNVNVGPKIANNTLSKFIFIPLLLDFSEFKYLN